MRARGRSGTTLALCAFFVVVQFYASLASLAPTPPVGYVFATPAIAAVLVAVLVLATLVALLALLRDGATPNATSRAMLCAWIGSALVSSVLGLDPGSGLQVVGAMLMAGVFHVALVRYYRQPGLVRALLGSYLGVGLLASLAALGMAASRIPAALWSLNHGRAAGFFVTANQFAAFLIAFVFVALGTALADAGGLRRLAALSVVVALTALGATVSQAGWLGAAAGGTFLAWTLGARRAAGTLVLGIVLVAGAIALRPAAGHNPAEAFDRLRIWRAGIRVAELFPLTGTGPMGYWRVYPAARPTNGDLPGTFGALHPHDVYLSLAGETGALGLAALVYGWWRFVKTVRVRLRACGPAERHLALGVCAALVAVLVQGVFDTIGVIEMTFVWIPYTALALAAAELP